jgi:hypothetical protein
MWASRVELARFRSLPSVEIHEDAVCDRSASRLKTVTIEAGSRWGVLVGSLFAGCHSLKSIALPAYTEDITGIGFALRELSQITLEGDISIFP